MREIQAVHPHPNLPHHKGEGDKIRNCVFEQMTKQIGQLGFKTEFINSKERDIVHSFGVKRFVDRGFI